MTLSTRSTSRQRILEAALNRCLPRHEIFVRATTVGDIFTSGRTNPETVFLITASMVAAKVRNSLHGQDGGVGPNRRL